MKLRYLRQTQPHGRQGFPQIVFQSPQTQYLKCLASVCMTPFRIQTQSRQSSGAMVDVITTQSAICQCSGSRGWRGGGGGGGGKCSQSNFGEVCKPLPKYLTLFMTKHSAIFPALFMTLLKIRYIIYGRCG